MAVTFWCPDAPRKQVPCRFCTEWRENGWIEEGERCDQFCTGTTEESLAPETQVTGSDAGTLLRALGFESPVGEEPYGSCKGGELRRRILKLRNQDITSMNQPFEVRGGELRRKVVDVDGVPTIQMTRGASLIAIGVDEDRTLRRLARLEDLAVWAQENGDLDISWG